MSKGKRTKFSDNQPASPLLVGDGLQNVVANLGTGRDKAAYTSYTSPCLPDHELIQMYENSWLAAAIVDYPAEDATRNWRKWQAEKDQITKIEAEEKRLKLKQKTQEALKTARLISGAAIYINTKEQDQSKPFNPAREEIDSLVVLSKSQLTTGETVKDIRSPYFGKPEFYKINSQNNTEINIHASRFAVFNGAKTPVGDANYSFDSWGKSVIQSTLDAIRNTDATMANIASLVFEAKIDVIKFKGFTSLLGDKSGKGDALVFKRLTTQMAMKGINGAVVIDSEDDYEQKNASFSGLPEVARTFQQYVSGAARIPETRLFGRAASGLSGSGDGDERVYYDRINDMQTDDIAEALSLIDECIIHMALGGRPGDVYYTWAPLRQKTENDIADILGKIATAARTLAGNQAGEIIPIDALGEATVNAIIEAGAMPGLEQAVEKYGTIGEQTNLVNSLKENGGDE